MRVNDTEFEIHHGNTLTNDWDILCELNPANDSRCRGYGDAARAECAEVGAMEAGTTTRCPTFS